MTYTKVDNEILDFLFSVDMSAAELQILIFLTRMTKGFNRNTAKVSYSYIANGTGLSVSTVKRTILKFLSEGVISEVRGAGSKTERIIRLEWSKLIRNRTNSDTQSYQVRYHFRIKADHQERKEEITTQERKEEEREIHSFSDAEDKKLTLEELAAWSQMEDDDDGDL